MCLLLRTESSDPGLLLLFRWRRGLRGGCCACRRIRERIGQELADNLRHLRRGYEIVVTVARHDRRPRLRQLRVQPARLPHAAPQKREELRNVLLRDRVVVREHQKHRHGQLRDVGGPVIVLAHHVAHLVEELRKAPRLGPLL
jgi:hypothetical protein